MVFFVRGVSSSLRANDPGYRVFGYVLTTLWMVLVNYFWFLEGPQAAQICQTLSKVFLCCIAKNLCSLKTHHYIIN